MKQTKTLLAVCVILILAVVGLVGCGEQSDFETEIQSPTSTTATTFTEAASGTVSDDDVAATTTTVATTMTKETTTATTTKVTAVTAKPSTKTTVTTSATTVATKATTAPTTAITTTAKTTKTTTKTTVATTKSTTATTRQTTKPTTTTTTTTTTQQTVSAPFLNESNYNGNLNTVSINPRHVYWQDGMLVAECFVINGFSHAVSDIYVEELTFRDGNGALLASGEFGTLQNLVLGPMSYTVWTFTFSPDAVYAYGADLSRLDTFSDIYHRP